MMKFLLSILLLCPPLILLSQYTPGNTYFGANDYIQYEAGNLPIVISAPHGGYLEPSIIPDRDCAGCAYVRDAYTQELSQEIRAAIFELTGCYPHIIINRLHRKKLDANREIVEAADGDAMAEQAWEDFHVFIEASKNQTITEYGKGLFIDLHGHAHDIQRLELGYLMSKSDLQQSDATLNTNSYIEESSIQHLVSNNLNGYTHAALLRGNYSFGTLIDDRGFPAVPSSVDPFPDSGDSFFSGGYNTRRHGSFDGGTIDGIQIECNQDVRFVEATRLVFADSLAATIVEFVERHIVENFSNNFCTPLRVENRRISKLQIFPNPVCESVTFDTQEKFEEIWIYNLQGTMIKRYQIETSKDIRLDGLSDGNYFVVAIKNSQMVGRTMIHKKCNQ